MADLMRAIELPVEVDFMAVSSYGAATKTMASCESSRTSTWTSPSATCSLLKTCRLRPHAELLAQYLGARDPKSLEVCALLLKVGEQRVEQSLKYVGFSIPADFVVGFGLDVNERYRNLDAIYTYTGDV